MNQEIKNKWVAALRSGEFKQGFGQLRSNECHCCLGVLCELYQRETGKGTWTGTRFETGGEESSSTGLTPSVRIWAGISSPVIISNLIIRNDGVAEPHDFQKIAAYIEETL